MTKINILDSSVYNQISAGEVVENPASIVKELIENSIDAGAQNISVYIEDGGIKSVQVVDDGEGMTQDDLSRSILPHATSKIRIAEDLYTVSTLGFRGEALASVAAVSAVDIRSKHFESPLAYGIEVKGGEITKSGVIALSKGTSITVSNLFYNTPARYKFLKSKRGEESAITDLMADVILANANVAIRYYIDKKLVFCSSGENLFAAVKSVYSEEIAQNLIEINCIEAPYTILGYIAKPATAAIKHNRNSQTLIINGRVIKDFTLSSVVQNAYGESLMKKTFPVFVLDIILPFDKVDVNVHPNKKDVRFSADCKINSVLYKAIKSALLGHTEELSGEMSLFRAPEQTSAVSATTQPVCGLAAEERMKQSDYQERLYSPPLYTQSGKDSFSDELSGKLDNLAKMPPITVQYKKFSDNKSVFDVSYRTLPNYKVVGQLFDTYIVAEYGEAAFFIDQHAAHERKLYDAFIESFKERNIDVQELLVPYLYEGNAEILLKNSTILQAMGFFIEDFGGGMIKILSVPLVFEDIDLDVFFSSAAETLSSGTETNNLEIIKDKLAKKACKSAIKGGKALSNEDIQYILDTYFKSGLPLQCPHGRPVVIKITKQEMEKMFRRIV